MKSLDFINGDGMKALIFTIQIKCAIGMLAGRLHESMAFTMKTPPEPVSLKLATPANTFAVIHRRGVKSKFTLIEVVVALTVLGLAIISASAMCSQSITRIVKAKARWADQHMISQAAEYFLLAGPNSQVPNDIFPYRNVRVSCSVANAEGLPAGVDAVSGQWRLATYEIRLTGASGEKIHSLKIDKIIQVSDR